MNKIFSMLILFLTINLHASIEKKIKKNISMLHNNVKKIVTMIEGPWDKSEFAVLYIEDLKHLKEMCKLVIEDSNSDLFEYVLLTTDEKNLRLEKNVELFFSHLFTYIEDHAEDEKKLQKTMRVFKQNGYQVRKISSEILLLLHKNRAIAPYLLEKLDELITELSY